MAGHLGAGPRPAKEENTDSEEARVGAAGTAHPSPLLRTAPGQEGARGLKVGLSSASQTACPGTELAQGQESFHPLPVPLGR